MATTNLTGVSLLGKVNELEHRLESLAHQVRALERHAVELDALRQEVGKLKFELEEMREE